MGNESPIESREGVAAGPREPVLYLVALAHLDTQWRWTVRDTIARFLPATLRANFALFEEFPSHILSFEGAFRYMLVREYYPREFERLARYVRAGRWHPAGAMLDAVDVNLPSPESLIRQVLHGNGFFARAFGRRSRDLLLPDNFGFGHALPSVAAHCGLAGFSSQKFGRWMAPACIPFEIGRWRGPDGAEVVAAIAPGGYGEGLREDPSRSPAWVERLERLHAGDAPAGGYRYFGPRGDRGGAPDRRSLALLEAAVRNPGPLRVVSVPSEQLFVDLAPEDAARLPAHTGELLLPTHGTGCWTSGAAMKRWNRMKEQLADAAERAAVIAAWLGTLPYPRRRLADAWVRFLWHQMHDDLTGTSIPAAYACSWNDEAVALNQFADVLTAAVGGVARALDTRAEGVPLVVFNPLSCERQDPVEARVRFPGRAPEHVRVFDAEGREVPSQAAPGANDGLEIVFLARLPPIGFAVFDVRPSAAPCALDTGLAVTEAAIENERYRGALDGAGDLASLFDRDLGRELLAGPARLELLADRPGRWPAWEIRFEDLVAEPRELVGPPAETRIVERGPARVALAVERRVRGSTITQRLRLAAGAAGARLEFDVAVDWRTRGRLLKARFPFACASAEATYDLGLGTIARGNNRREKYEVPAQQWADLTDRRSGCGVSVLTDCKYGWDKPDDATLRLSLLRSPATGRRFRHQAAQDLGRHRFLYALYAHAGDWSAAATVGQAARLNQPLRAFQLAPHAGPLGRRFAFLREADPRLLVAACKQAEETDEVVVRLREIRGRPLAAARLALAAQLVAAREVNGAEEPVGPAEAADGSLTCGFRGCQPRAFALRLAPPPVRLAPPVSRPLALPYDLQAASFHGRRPRGDFDGRGHTLPGELLPREIVSAGVRFELGPLEPGNGNALACRGQQIPLPAEGSERLHLLAAAVRGDTTAVFLVGDREVALSIQHYTGHVGSWDGRGRLPGTRGRPGFLRRDPIAWLGTHRHDARGRDEPYVFCYLFRYRIDLPPETLSIRLPRNPRIRILAMTAARGDEAAEPARLLYD